MHQKVQCSFKRYEKKYLLTEVQYKKLLHEMQAYVKPDEFGKTTNCSLYYDTDNWELIRKSIEKPIYKEKLRVRSYGVPQDNDTVFIEIKKKYDSVVYKRRMTLPADRYVRYLEGETQVAPKSQIGNEVEWFQQRYQAKPKVYIAYDRTSFAGIEDSQLRITFDQNIRFREYALDLREGDFGERILPVGTVLMEIKIPGTTPLWLVSILSSIGAKPSSFSKYGTYYKEYVVNKVNHNINYKNNQNNNQNINLNINQKRKEINYSA